MAQKFTVVFYECEHSEDIDKYIDDLEASGAKVLESSIDEDTEEGIVKCECEHFRQFFIQFKQTESFEFSNLSTS
jgi:hypothetical protein